MDKQKKVTKHKNIDKNINKNIDKDNDKVIDNNDIDKDGIPNYINIKKTIPIYISRKKYKKILVLSGGGIKGISFIGAFKAFEELNFLDKFEIFAGTSVGALIISLYVIGYTPDELYEFVMKFDFSKLKQINISNVFNNMGLDNGTKIEYVIQRLISAKGYDPYITLKDLYDRTKKKIIFTTVCINTVDVCYISYENYPQLPLLTAIRMSISIPIFYTPVKYNNYFYIDGGCIDNYPIKLFKNELENVIGIYINDKKNTIRDITNIETYISRVFQCLLEGITYNSKKGYEDYTIDIDLYSNNIINYDITNQQKEEMFNKGYESIIKHFKNK